MMTNCFYNTLRRGFLKPVDLKIRSIFELPIFLSITQCFDSNQHSYLLEAQLQIKNRVFFNLKKLKIIVRARKKYINRLVSITHIIYAATKCPFKCGKE